MSGRRRTSRFAGLLLGLVLLDSAAGFTIWLTARVSPMPSRPGATAVVRPDEAVFTFPPVPTDSLGYDTGESIIPVRDSLGNWTSARVGRWMYFWLASVALPDSRAFDRWRRPPYYGVISNDYNVVADFRQEDGKALSEAQLAVALHGAHSEAELARGEPAHVDRIPGAQVVMSLENGRVVMRLRGREAIARIFAERRRWIELAWLTRAGPGAIGYSEARVEYAGW